MNIYTAPSDQVAVAGEASRYPSHGHISAKVPDHYIKEQSVSAWIDGTNVVVRIEGHRASEIREEPSRSILIGRYLNAFSQADKIARELGGRVTIELEDEDVSVLIAKILGRLHQAESLSKTGSMLIQNSKKKTASACYLYNTRTGTRFFFLDDLLKLADELIKPEVPLNRAKGAFAELNLFLTTRNRIQNPEGKIFLVDKDTLKDIPDPNSSWRIDLKVTISDTLDSLNLCDSDEAWHQAQVQLLGDFKDTLIALKSRCAPLFHSIKLDSNQFVERVSSNLKARHNPGKFGGAFSTPVHAIEFGAKDLRPDSDGRFILTTQDSWLKAIYDWLLSSNGRSILRGLGIPSLESCDHIAALQPYEGLTYDPYPTRLTRKIGHIPKESLVLDLGDSTQGISRKIIISNNPYSSRSWSERIKQGASYATDILRIVGSPLIASRLHQAYLDKQWNAFKVILDHLGSPALKLAPRPQITSISERQNDHTYDINVSDFDNALVGPFIDGPRVDKLAPGFLNNRLQDMAMGEVGTLLAASLVANLPLQHRDIILNLEGGAEESRVTLTLLKVTESFSDNTNSGSAQRYLETVGPLFVANHLVRWTTIILKKSPPNLTNQRQNDLIEIALTSLTEGLGRLSSNGIKVPLADKIIEISAPSRVLLGLDPTAKIPEILDISQHLETSLDIIDGRYNLSSFISAIRRRAHKEIQLIRAVSPQVTESQTPEDFVAAESAATAVSEIIFRHLSEGGHRLQEVRAGLKLIAPIQALDSYEKTWLIQLLDIDTRCKELALSADQMQGIFSSALSSTDTPEDFAAQIRDSSPLLNLPDQTLCKLYEALQGIKGALDNPELNNTKKRAIKRNLKRFRNIPPLFS
jgi:hypothetical protein